MPAQPGRPSMADRGGGDVADEGRAVGGDEGEQEGAGGAQGVDDGGLGAVGVGGGQEGVGDERGDGGRVVGGFGADEEFGHVLGGRVVLLSRTAHLARSFADVPLAIVRCLDGRRCLETSTKDHERVAEKFGTSLRFKPAAVEFSAMEEVIPHRPHVDQQFI